MICDANNIKEILPAYLRHELDDPDARRVEAHLASCDDCRNELSLLGMMSEETVPDPGASFWTEMPVTIERQVRRLQTEKSRFRLPDFFAEISIPIAWATAAAVLLTATAVWFVVRPVPLDIASNSAQDGSAFEDTITEETINLAELSATELQATGQWAQNEYGRIQQELAVDHSENTEQDFSEDISNLSPEELDRIYELLKKREHDIEKRIRNKTNQVNEG